MMYKTFTALLCLCTSMALSTGDFARAETMPEREFSQEEVYIPKLNALCAAGEVLGEGCAAIRARRVVDASAMPWRAIGRVNFASVRTRSHCTGTLVSERIVLTAAHCLYNHSRATWIPAQSLRFVAGYARGTSVAVSDVERYILDPVHDAESHEFRQSPSLDWALLVLKKPIGREVGFTILSSISDEEMDAADVMLAGYANLRAHVLSVTDECASPEYQHARSLIITRCPVMKGDSGAPLLMLDDGVMKVIGSLAAVGIKQSGLQNMIVPVSTVLPALRTETDG